MENELTWLFLLTATLAFLHVFMDIVSHRKPFKRVLNNRGTWQDQLLIIVLFGGFSILGTYMGTELPSGAILNYRDLGAMIAGLIGGPVVGLGAGLIGGVHRFFMGGFTAVPCALSTIFIGLICGIIKYKNGNRLVSIQWAIIIAIMMECLHMGMTLLIARPFEEALAVVKLVILPMIIANAVGVMVALFLIKNKQNEIMADDSKEKLEE
jgi:sigma-B regulation protein RsbU (phosphoserine phosphatase)